MALSEGSSASSNVILVTDGHYLGYMFVMYIPSSTPIATAKDLIGRAAKSATKLYPEKYEEYQLHAAAELLMAMKRESPSSVDPFLESGQTCDVSKQPESSSTAKSYSKFTTAEIWKLVTCVSKYATTSGIDWSAVIADESFTKSNRKTSKLKDKWYDLIKRAANNRIDYIHTEDILAQVRLITKGLDQKQKKKHGLK